QRVEDAYAARLYDEVGGGRLLERRQRVVFSVGGVHHHPGPIRIGDVAVRLALVRVGLVERDPVAAPVERAYDATIVGRRAVPVCGYEARSEEGDMQPAHTAAAERSWPMAVISQ